MSCFWFVKLRCQSHKQAYSIVFITPSVGQIRYLKNFFCDVDWTLGKWFVRINFDLIPLIVSCSKVIIVDFIQNLKTFCFLVN